MVQIITEGYQERGKKVFNTMFTGRVILTHFEFHEKNYSKRLHFQASCTIQFNLLYFIAV